MSWLDQIGGLLQQYAGASPHHPPPQTEDVFQQLARAAPPGALAQGLAHAFRSNETPPFEQMVGQLFRQADPNQRADLMNTLLAAVGPQLASAALGGGGPLGGLAGLLTGGGGVSPAQTHQIPVEAVQQLAGYAERGDPSIIDTVSGFFSQHPGLIQTLGAGALTAALSGLARQQQQGGYGDVLPASQDPYGDPADQEYAAQGGYPGDVMPASMDPYGDPADEINGQPVMPSSQDPYGDPADRR